MKSLNVRLLAILVGTVFVLGIGIYALHYFQSLGMASFHLEEARKLSKIANPEAIKKAQENYGRYLKSHPEDTDVQAEVGMFYAGLADTYPSFGGDAFLKLEKVLRDDPMRDNVRRKVIELAMRFRKYDDALSHIRIFQTNDPDNGELLELQAQCEVGKQEYMAAKRTYEKAIRQSPDLLDAYVGLAYLLRDHLNDVDLHDDTTGDQHGLKDAPETPIPNEEAKKNDVETDAPKQDAPEKPTPKNESVKDDTAPKDSPEAAEVVTDEVSAEQLADRWINAMVEKNPGSAKAYYYRARYLLRQNQLDDAEKDIAEALKLKLDDLDTLLLATQLKVNNQNFEEANKYAEQAVKFFPESPKAYLLIVNVERTAGNTDKAKEWLSKGLAKTGDTHELLLQKAELLFAEGDTASIPAVIDRLRELHIPPALISFLEGRLAFEKQEWGKARTNFEQVRGDSTRIPPRYALEADSYLYQTYLKLGLDSLAKGILDEHQRTAGDATQTKGVRAETFIAQGKFDQGIAYFQRLLQSEDAPPEAWIELAKLLTVQNIKLPELQRNWAKVDNALNKASGLIPDSPELTLARANVLLVQKRKDEALALLEKAAKAQATQWPLWELLLRLAHSEKDWDTEAKILDEADQYMTLKTPVRLARARMLVARDGAKSADALKQLGEQVEGLTDSEKAFYWDHLAGYCLQAEDLGQARTLWRQAADKSPGDLMIRVKLFEAARRMEDQAAMKQVLREIGDIEQKGHYWHFYTAVSLLGPEGKEDIKSMDAATYDKIMDHLMQARLLSPDWWPVPMLLAKLQDKRGDKDAAIESYLEAVEQGTTDTKGMTRLATLLMEQGRDKEANRIIAMLEERKADLPTNLKLKKVQELIQAGDIEGGVAGITNLAEMQRKEAEGSDDYRRYLSLSQTLRALGMLAKQQNKPEEAEKNYGEAEQAIRRAAELSPQTGQVWTDLIVILTMADKTQEISDVLEQIKKNMPEDEATLTLAQCYEFLGRTVEADQQYEKASLARKDDDKMPRLLANFYLRAQNKYILAKDKNQAKEYAEKAEAMLNGIVNGQRATSKADLSWARRQLALVLLQKGNHTAYHQAMQLVDANLKDKSDSIPDKRLKARLLSRRPSRTDRLLALDIFKELVNIRKPAEDDRFELAKLYFTEGEWNKSSEQLSILLASGRIRPEWLDFSIRAQIRAGEYEGAEAKLDEFRKMNSDRDPFSVVLLQSRIYCGRNRHDRAIRLIKDYVNDSTFSGATRAQRALRAAQTLENLAKRITGPGRDAAVEQYLKQAELYYREFVQAYPEKISFLISFLGQCDQREKAMEVVMDKWDEKKPIGLAVNAVGLLVRGDPKPSDVQQVDIILTEALEKHGDNTSLLLAIAELRAIQKRYDDAEKVYRQVLAKEGEADNIVALNNLAVFLAFRKLKLEEAMQHINRAIELAGPVATLLDSRAIVHLASDQWQEALDDLSMALAEEPTDTRFFHQAQAYYQLGQKENALESMQQADSLGLKADHLQALERPAYRQLKEDLKN